MVRPQFRMASSRGNGPSASYCVGNAGCWYECEDYESLGKCEARSGGAHWQKGVRYEYNRVDQLDGAYKNEKANQAES